MPKKQKGGRFHPSIISGHQKFLRAKQANKILEEKAEIIRKRRKLKTTTIKELFE